MTETDVPEHAAASLVAAGLIVAVLSLSAGAVTAADSRLITTAGIAAYNAGDHANAYRLLKSAADLGDSDAEVNLGYMYARGEAVKENQAEAIRLYRLSAEREIARA